MVNGCMVQCTQSYPSREKRHCSHAARSGGHYSEEATCSANSPALCQELMLVASLLPLIVASYSECAPCR